MVKRILPALLLLVIGFPSGPVAASPESPEPLHIRLVSGSVGGTFLPVGHAIARWLERSLAHVVVEVDTTSGSVDNIRRLAAGEADLAIVGLSPLRAVYQQHSRFHIEEFCILGTLYIDAEQYVIDKSFVRVGTLMDLNGVHMYPGPHRSGGEVDTRKLLSALDIEPRYVYPLERDKGYAEAARALAEGEFHAATFSGGVPIRAVTDLFEAHADRFVILPFSRFQMNRVSHRDLDFVSVEIPGGAYPGVYEPIWSVGSPNVLIAGPSLDPMLAGRIRGAMEAGIAEPGVGLRNDVSHPVLQNLTQDLWRIPTIELGCSSAPAIADSGEARVHAQQAPGDTKD